MEIFEGHRALFRPLASPSVALGNFDGVHRGHQALLARAIAAARRGGGDAVAFTFDPHPAAVLAPDRAPRLITTRGRKLELLAAAGIDACVVEPFTRALAALSPDDFARTVLCDILGARHVVIGYDFAYGARRAGTPETLAAFGRDHGFSTEIVEPVAIDGVVASSSRIRSCLEAGETAEAAALLGRPFDVDGVVVHGAGRGRTIGVPTANVRVEAEILPAPGVYAVRLQRLQSTEPGTPPWLPGVANLGTNPTFVTDGALGLEVHLLDLAPTGETRLGPRGDLYDQRVRVAFIERQRPEQRFASVDALIAQIQADIARAREILGANKA
jgi:riboflavin kinase/FMN adenylyltransferase